jgi:hypothetical protein
MIRDPPVAEIPDDRRFPFPALRDELIDRILCGQPIDSSAPEEAHLLAEWVATLRRPARPGELRGEPWVVAAFLWAVRYSGARESNRRQLRPSVRAGIAGAAIVGAISAVGVAAAATGSLPVPLQAVAHVLFGAPPPSADDSGGDEPTGSAGTFRLPADLRTPIPSQPPPVGISMPSTPPEPAPGQPDVSAEKSALAPTATDTYGTTGLQETAPALAPSEPPESSGGPPADVEPKGAPPESPKPPGGPPADVGPKAAPPAQPESPGGPPAQVERKAALPRQPNEVGNPPAPAVDLSQGRTAMAEQPGKE